MDCHTSTTYKLVYFQLTAQYLFVDFCSYMFQLQNVFILGEFEIHVTVHHDKFL